ncbi:MAG: hypothetical protein KF782_00040 [Labilithrix sp.]|nr:hypothetical protein [Labilithrix sp.]
MVSLSSHSSRAFALAALPFAIVAACGGDDPVKHEPADGVTDPDSGTRQTPATDAAPGPPDAGGESFDPTGQSGSRLRRRYLEAGPGAYRTLSFWDSELEVSCAFAEASDGQLRCLPDARSLANVYFNDAACSEPVMNLQGCGRWFGRVLGTQYYRPTITTTTSGSVLYQKEVDGSCRSFSTAPMSLLVAEALPSARFVLGAAKDAPRTNGTVARYVDGADGSGLLVGAIDAARGTPCDFTLEPGRCFPPPQSWAVVMGFADASCSSPVAQIYDSGEPALAIQTARTSEGCPAGRDYYEIGARIDAPTVYVRNAENVCTAQSTSNSYHYYHVGARVALSSFPRAELRQEGTGEVVARRYVDTDGEPLRPSA